ncbi:MAG: glycosyltransferase family 4 protein, partial [Pseudomonadota bacterium]
MKIGIVTEYYYPTLGGIQEHVHHFAQAARQLGHDVRIVTPVVMDTLASLAAPAAGTATARDDRDHGVIRLGRSIPVFSGGSVARVSSGPGLSAQVSELLRREQFDVVHLHSPLMPTLPLLFLRQSSALTVGTFHSVVGRSLLYAALRASLQRYADRLDAAIGVSETALVDLKRTFRAPWHVIPNGVDVAAFAAGRRRPELDDGRLNVLHVGRFDPRNGVHRVIRAWVRV